MKFIKQYLAEILIITGTAISSYFLLSFSSSRGCGLDPFGDLGSECSNPIEYFYTDEVKFSVVVGLAVLVLGIIIYKKRK